MNMNMMPGLPHLGLMVHFDPLVLPKWGISPRFRTGNTVQSQPGDTIAAGTEPPKAL